MTRNFAIFAHRKVLHGIGISIDLDPIVLAQARATTY